MSVQQWMTKNWMPERVRQELFIAMGKALDFIDSDKLSMTVGRRSLNPLSSCWKRLERSA